MTPDIILIMSAGIALTFWLVGFTYFLIKVMRYFNEN